MIIRCALIGGTSPKDALRADLPSYSMLTDNVTTRRTFVDVPIIDVPADVQAFVTAYPTVDLTTPLPVPFPPSLALSWSEYLARRYDLGTAKWHPVVY